MDLDLDNSSFSMAWSFINYTDQNVFLTGNAGTGKTTFLHQLKEQCPKKMAVLAPTGVAAINAGGVTIHSFFQLPFGSFIPDEHPQWNNPNSKTFNKQSLFRNLRLRKKQRDIIRNLELLVIDEVSMVRADLLDAIDITLRGVRRNQHQPFGGVQVLFIGDLFQLPPVVRDEDWSLLGNYYASPFFFDAQVIHQAPPVPITLQKIYRQQNDLRFIGILNKIRFNTIEHDDLNHLNQHVIDKIPKSDQRPITLTTHNRQADAINRQELAKLPGNAVNLTASVIDNFPENTYPAEYTLELKEGAQVMFIKNEKGDARRYYNGKIGRIKKIHRVKQMIEIECDQEIIELSPEQWDNIRYDYDEKNDEIQELKIGSFEQFPIRLAWAVTVHKSQGLTFEEAYIDLGHAFAPGQVYVALSRLTNLDGLHLLSPIQRHHIKTDERVLAYSTQQPEENEINNYLKAQQVEYVKNLFINIYDLNEVCEEIRTHASSYGRKLIQNKKEAFDWAQNLLPTVFDIILASDKYTSYLKYHLLNSQEVDWQAVMHRNDRALPYFQGLLESNLVGQIINQISKYKGQTLSGTYLKELDFLKAALEAKLEEIKFSKNLLSALQETSTLNEVLSTYFTLKNNFKPDAKKEEAAPTSVKKEKMSSEQVTLTAFQDGKTIEEIAEDRNLQVNTIQKHLVSVYPAFRLHIDDLVAPNIRKQIVSLLHERDDWKSKELIEQLEGTATYNDIAAARKYYDTIMNQKKD